MNLPYEVDVPDKLLQHIRLFFGDVPEFNRLIEGTEVSDEKMRLGVQLWLQHFNAMPPEVPTKYHATNFPDYLVMYHGVVIELLKMAGLVHTRNFLNFNDNGVSFTVSDKGNEYLQWIQNLLQTHAQDVKDLKVALNAESAYDHISSPEDMFNYEEDGLY